MQRALAIGSAVLLAVGCSAPQVDFCGKSCTASSQCGSAFYCNTVTGTCQPTDGTCPGTGGSSSGGASGTGSSSGGASGGPRIGSTCTPPEGTTTDPCLANGAGLACNSLSDGGDACSLPLEFETCVSSVGCDLETPPLSCLEITPTGEAAEWECLNTCTVTANCPDIDDSCQSGVCWTNFCGPNSLADGGSDGIDYYDPCDSAGTGDGTCLPYEVNDEEYGFCEGAGALPAGAEACGERLLDGGTADLCSFGSICVLADTTDRTFCAPLCASGTATGPTCSGSNVCENLYEGVYLFGACEEVCASNADCTAPLTCQGDFCLP